MASEIVEVTMLPQQHQEMVTLMNDYGVTIQVYINISMQEQRQTLIDDKVRILNNMQADFEAYAAKHNINIESLKAEGLAKKAAMQKEQQGQ